MSFWSFGRRVAGNAGRVVRLAAGRFAFPAEGGVWVSLRLESPLEELVAPQLAVSRAPRLGLLDALHALEAAAKDPRVAGVVLRFTGPLGGLARALSLRRGVDALRAADKAVVAWSESYAADAYLAASGADRVYLPETGAVLLVGVRMESLHLRDLLERLGVRPDIVSVGSHKGAGERFTRRSLSPENREQLEALADGLYQDLLAGIASGRALAGSRVRDLVDAGPYAAPAARDAGLIDGVRYPDEVEAELADWVPATAVNPRDGRPRLLDASAYLALAGPDPGWRPLVGDVPHVAYVVARGAIHRGRGPRGIASEPMRRLLDGLRRDDAVRAVVLRIDSPGGDAVTSDLLWRAASLLRGDKPLVVSMGDVAASGGYFMAAAADAVFAESATLTGSIGVVGGKPDLGGLLDKVGVDRDGVERGARAGMLSATRGFTADERAAYRAMLDATYGVFTDRVARGRGLAPERVAELAGGRVYSGREARTLGLVDELGGPLEALADARRRAEVGPEARYLLETHPRLPPVPRWLVASARAVGRFQG